jgi:hypothetical protein
MISLMVVKAWSHLFFLNPIPNPLTGRRSNQAPFNFYGALNG